MFSRMRTTRSRRNNMGKKAVFHFGNAHAAFGITAKRFIHFTRIDRAFGDGFVNILLAKAVTQADKHMNRATFLVANDYQYKQHSHRPQGGIVTLLTFPLYPGQIGSAPDAAIPAVFLLKVS